jgi:hypothetical protein
MLPRRKSHQENAHHMPARLPPLFTHIGPCAAGSFLVISYCSFCCCCRRRRRRADTLPTRFVILCSLSTPDRIPIPPFPRQDLGELEQAATLKEGATRTPKRVAATDKWFKQSLGDYDRFLQYFAPASK